jgi:hypothetical protein
MGSCRIRMTTTGTGRFALPIYVQYLPSRPDWRPGEPRTKVPSTNGVKISPACALSAAVRQFGDVFLASLALKQKAASCRRTPKRPAALPLDADRMTAFGSTAGVFARFGVRWHDTALARQVADLAHSGQGWALAWVRHRTCDRQDSARRTAGV